MATTLKPFHISRWSSDKRNVKSQNHRSKKVRAVGHRLKVRAGHEEPRGGFSHADAEAFWAQIVKRNFKLLRGSWSNLELVVGVPWLARERERQMRAYKREYGHDFLGVDIEDDMPGSPTNRDQYAADQDDLEQALVCLELAKEAYSAHASEHKSALDHFLDTTMVRSKDVHFVQDTSTFMELAAVPGHVIITSHKLKAVTIIIRGTEVRDKAARSWLPVDVMADLAAESEPFLGGHAHHGMMMAACKMLSIHSDLLHALLARHVKDGYGLHVIGHSLGAGVATLIALLLEQHPRFKGNVECTVFSPPQVLSLQLARDSARFIKSYILENDIIPRLSVSSINRLHQELKSYAWRRGAADEIRAEIMFKATGNRNASMDHHEDVSEYATLREEITEEPLIVTLHKNADDPDLHLDQQQWELAGLFEESDAQANPSYDDLEHIESNQSRDNLIPVLPTRESANAQHKALADDDTEWVSEPPYYWRPMITEIHAQAKPLVETLKDKSLPHQHENEQAGFFILPELAPIMEQSEENPEVSLHSWIERQNSSNNEQPRSPRQDYLDLEWDLSKPRVTRKAKRSNGNDHQLSWDIAGLEHAKTEVTETIDELSYGSQGTVYNDEQFILLESFDDLDLENSMIEGQKASPSTEDLDELGNEDKEIGEWWSRWLSTSPREREEVLKEEEKEVEKELSFDFLEEDVEPNNWYRKEGAKSQKRIRRHREPRCGDHYKLHRWSEDEEAFHENRDSGLFSNNRNSVEEDDAALYPPGRIFHLVSNGIKDESQGGRVLVRAADATDFTEIPLSISAITNHNPCEYERLLRRACKYAPEEMTNDEVLKMFQHISRLRSDKPIESFKRPFRERIQWALKSKLL